MLAIVQGKGTDAALAALDTARATDPQADVFREPALNRLGYRIMRSRTAADSLPIFRKLVEWYPTSANAYDSLSEALEAAGQRQEAIAVTERGLAVLATQDLTPEQRRDMAALLEGRLKRLK